MSSLEVGGGHLSLLERRSLHFEVRLGHPMSAALVLAVVGPAAELAAQCSRTNHASRPSRA